MDTDPPVLTEDQINRGEILWSFLSSPRKVVRIDSNIVVKLGPSLDLVEAETMKFIRQNTNIPVPKILNSYKKDGFGYILMEFVEGHKLGDLWPKLGQEARSTILSELRDYVRQMRQIKAPVDVKIGSVIGGPSIDRRVMGAVKGGPFESEEEFNIWQLAQLQSTVPLLNRNMYTTMHRTDHKIVFSHGDLGFHNVLVHNGHVTAIIDWEDAGWFPEHWDYCKSAGHLSGSDELYLVLKQLYEKEYLTEFMMDMWFTREVKHGGF